MRLLIPEIASPIGFFVTSILFTFFVVMVVGVLRKGKSEFSETESLPLADD